MAASEEDHNLLNLFKLVTKIFLEQPGYIGMKIRGFDGGPAVGSLGCKLSNIKPSKISLL